MLEKHETASVLSLETVSQLSRRMELLFEPEWKPHEEEFESGRRVRDVRFEEPFELHQRLVVEDHEVEVGLPDAGFAETVIDGLLREAIVVLLPAETLFLGRSDDPAIAHQGRGAIVVVRGDSENVHVVRRA